MQLTYNKFKQVVNSSSERLFSKITESIATSDNAALVAMFDDKLILLDEDNEQLYLCNYLYENGTLTIHKFEEIGLTENDASYLEEVVGQYFDLDDKRPVAVSDLMTGFNLKFKNDSNSIFMEAIDRKHRKIMESPKIKALKKVREVRNVFSEEIKNLLEEPFMQHLNAKLYAKNQKGGDSIAPAFNKVNFKTPYPIFVNTDQGGESKDLITLRDNTNVMDAMKKAALKISDKWKSDSFRSKFDKMINSIMQSESVELGRTAVLSFLDENKELFLLKTDLFEELITKTVLMLGEGNTDDTLEVFNKIMNSADGRVMKSKFFKANAIDEAKFNELNTLVEMEGGEEGGEEVSIDDEPKKEAGNDLDEEGLNKIIAIFKKIKESLEDDSQEREFIEDIVGKLESVGVQGIEDTKLKEIFDFLNSVEAPKEDKPEIGPEDPKMDSEEEIEL